MLSMVNVGVFIYEFVVCLDLMFLREDGGFFWEFDGIGFRIIFNGILRDRVIFWWKEKV